MKKITAFGGTNIKGADFRHELFAVNLFIGPNWSHKTARLDCIQLALAGFLPTLPRKNADIFNALSGRNDAVVAAIECDDGFGIARRYELKRESVSCSVVASNGAKDWTCAPVLIDANQFLALSGRERVKYLFDMLDLSKAETTPEALCAAVKNVKLEVNTERSEQVFGEVCEKISASRTKAASVQEWLDALVADLRDMKAETDREAKRLTATVQGLTQMRADQNPVNINRPIDAELATARALLEKINGEGAALAERIKGITSANAKARSEHEKATAERAAKLRRNDGRRAEIHASLQGIAQRAETVADMRHALEEAKTCIKEMHEIDHNGMMDLQRKHSFTLGDIQARNETLRLLRQAQAEDAANTTPCVCCGNSGSACLAATRRAEKFAADIREIEACLAGLQMTLAEHRVACETLKTTQDAQAMHNAEQVKHRQRVQKLSADLLALAQDSELETKLRQELTTLEVADVSPLGELPDTTDDEVLVSEKRAAYLAQKAVVTELEGVQREIVKVRGERATQAEAIASAALAEAKAEVVAEAVKIVEASQKKLVADAFGSVLEVANRLCAPLLRSPLVYHDGEFGRYNGTRFVRHATFSGTEKAVAYAALSVALGASSSMRIVMVDELGRMDSANKATFLEIVKRLVREEVIAQFIGIDVDAVDYNLTDVNVITTA